MPKEEIERLILSQPINAPPRAIADLICQAYQEKMPKSQPAVTKLKKRLARLTSKVRKEAIADASEKESQKGTANDESGDEEEKDDD